MLLYDRGFYDMLNNVKKNIRTSFPFLSNEHDVRHEREIFDTVQTMNISQTLNFSILLIIMELANLISYLAVAPGSRLLTPITVSILIFLLFMAFNVFCCEYLLKLERNERTRCLLKHHTHMFTGMFSLFCLCINYFCLKSRMSAESLLMFYIYIAAGPIYSFQEALTAILGTALLALPSFVAQKAPVAMYSNLFLYSFTSLFLSQMRCRITGTNLRLLREAWDEQVCLQDRADNDPLTQILNRNGFSQRLNQLLLAAMQLQAPVAVMMVDIDYFKQYNDTYGHMAGDECLKQVASALATHIHQGKDLICRFGGEEFQILMFGIKPRDAVRAAERLRQAVTELKLPAANKSAASCVTISIGISSAVPTSMEMYHCMVKAADEELYYAKNHGKNMVCFREVFPDRESDPCSVSAPRCIAASYELPRV